LQGLVLDGDAVPLVNKAREYGLLVSAVGGNVVRLVPALTVGKAEIDEAIEILDRALGDV
jgi:4-aminobutyrate aminotransferase-like enzyme